MTSGSYHPRLLPGMAVRKPTAEGLAQTPESAGPCETPGVSDRKRAPIPLQLPKGFIWFPTPSLALWFTNEAACLLGSSARV